MAASDSEIALSQIDGDVTFYDGGSNSLNCKFVQSDVESTSQGAPYVEAKNRNKHPEGAAPVLRKTGDGDVTGSMSLLITSMKGSTTVTPYEFVTFTGGAAGFTSTARGDRKAIKIVVNANATGANGANQTITYAYCVPQNVKISPAGANGLFLLSFDFTDHENDPVIA